MGTTVPAVPGRDGDRSLRADLDRVRAALGLGYDEGYAWFSVDEAQTPFAPHKTPGRRALLLVRWSQGPAVWVAARSRTSNTGLLHDPHDHRAEFAACWLSEPARIVTSKLFTVRRSLLCATTYMCSEPHAAVAEAVLASPCPP